MTKSERMKPVLQVADSREEQAAKALGECQRLLQERMQRLEGLQSYQAEYVRHFQEVGGAGATAQRLHDLQRFLANLATAIEQQQYQVELARQQCEKKRLLWQEARSKSIALEKVVARFQEDERMIAERKEQKVNDEHAMNKEIARRREAGEE